jgi:hypothetical protein
MIDGILENTSVKWEDRLGKRMRITTEEEVVNLYIQHERKNEYDIDCKLIKDDNQIYMINTYQTNNRGALTKSTIKLPDKPPHYVYEYQMINGNLRITRTTNGKEITTYDMVVTDRCEDGKVKSAEYRMIDTNMFHGKISCDRDENGKLCAEILELDNSKEVFHLDAEGRYSKMEFFDKEKLIETIQYFH